MSASNLPSGTLKYSGQSSFPPSPAPNTDSPVRIRASLRRGGNLLLDLPIAGRLTLGFFTAALIATLAASSIGVLRTQSLSRQSDFYQSLLQTNTSLNVAANFLQLMNTETHAIVDTAIQQNSKETLNTDKTAIHNLSNQYDQILSNYFSSNLVEKHPDQAALLNEAGHSEQISQQRTLAASVLRTWLTYRSAKDRVLQDVDSSQLSDAQALLHIQGEPTNADAQSALRSLIQFDQQLASSIHEAASIEEFQQLITTILGSILAFLLILLVGWIISGTLVKRLKQLRRMTRLVENGQLDARVTVVGRDEIADVSASVNAMLDAIMGLIGETRSQRDALTNAAEHLFSDMRVVSAGDLRINAPVTNDPIGMLANAFNFTVGRFRRFVLRSQTTIEQVEVISRQELEHAENFSIDLTNYIASPAFQAIAGQTTSLMASKTRLDSSEQNSGLLEVQEKDLAQRLQSTREILQRLSGQEGFSRHTRAILGLTEQISVVINKLSKAISIEQQNTLRTASGSLASIHVQELRTLETMLQRLTVDLQSVQHSTTRHFLELDHELAQMNGSLNLLKTTSTDNSSLTFNRAKETHIELVRQGQSFSSEITTLARKLLTLTQELRAGVVSFQLDTNDPSIASALNTPQNPHFSSKNPQNMFFDSSSKNTPIPTSPTNSVPLKSFSQS